MPRRSDTPRNRAALPPGADPQSLRGPDVHRTVAGDSRFRRQAEAQSGAASPRRQARGAGGRFHRPRNHQPQDRPHGAAARARAKCICASPARPRFRPCFYGVDTPTKSELIAANNTVEEIRRFIEADSLGYLSLGALAPSLWRTTKHEYCYACYTGRLSDRFRTYRAVARREENNPERTLRVCATKIRCSTGSSDRADGAEPGSGYRRTFYIGRLFELPFGGQTSGRPGTNTASAERPDSRAFGACRLLEPVGVARSVFFRAIQPTTERLFRGIP